MRSGRPTLTRRRRALLVTAAFLVFGAGVSVLYRAGTHSARVAAYQVTEIVPPPGFTSTEGGAINASGQITGRMFGFGPSGSPVAHGFLWKSGRVTDLGVLPGFVRSRGCGLNDKGQAVGTLEADTVVVRPAPGGSRSSSSVQCEGFQTAGGKMTPLPRLPGFTEGTAAAINGQGQIAGTAYTHGNDYGRGLLYDRGKMTSLETLGTLAGHARVGSIASGRNRSGQVVGTASAYDNLSVCSHCAFLYSKGTMRGLGSLPGYVHSFGAALNDKGQVVGTAAEYEPAEYGLCRAFLWQGGVRQDPGPLPGFKDTFGTALNAQGDVVGGGESLPPLQDFLQNRLPFSAPAPTEPPRHAFLYRSGRMDDLNGLIDPRSGWELETAVGINDAGQIVGTGTRGGATRAFVLTPLRAGAP